LLLREPPGEPSPGDRSLSPTDPSFHTFISVLLTELSPDANSELQPTRYWEPAPTIPNHDVTAQIGTGSTGTVWKARHRFVDQAVAVKVLADGFRDRTEERRRSFRIEALIARTLAHPNIVQVFDVGTTSTGLPFLSMELATRTLSIKDSLMTKLHALSAVAHALDHLHVNGVVHCDVKPSNILLVDGVRSDRWILADLGMAWRVHDPIALGAGTFGYVAPERFQRTPPTPASDIYSYARLAQHILTPSLTRPAINALNVPLAPSLANDPAQRAPRASTLLTDIHAALRK
jgi:eukaryotic-like serine/threonine-protein kinase